MQCGFCIPGQLMSAHALLEEHPHPTRAEIEEGMAGNLCRCACYEQIFDAIRDHRRAETRPMTGSRVGDSPNRVGGIDRVTGAQRYLADLPVADALHAKLVTLDCARARILGIDASEALALPGVHLVMTADDLPTPMPRYGPQNQDRPVLAVGETKYHGDPVALVVADTRDLAEAAARLVRVEHEELPAVFTVAGALAPDAPLVQDPVAAPRRPARRQQRAHGAPGRLGGRRRRGRACARRGRGPLHLPHGDPLRHRAARVHGGARR